MPFSASAAGPYVGGQLYASGLSSFGSSIGEGIQKAVEGARKAEEEQKADQVLLNYGKQMGLLSPEEIETYVTGSHSAKNGIILGMTRKFGMVQQQKEEEAREADRQARLKIAQAAEDRQRAEATWTPPAEAVEELKKSGGAYYPTGPGRYGLKFPPGGDEADTIDYTDPTTNTVHKISTRSALGQRVLEQTNPAQALLINTGLSAEELFDSDITKAGKLNPTTKQFEPSAESEATHWRIGDVVMEKEKAKYFQKRLNKAGQNPNAKQGPETPKAAPEKTKELSGADKEALDWANKNPNDPRAVKIKARLGAM